MTKQIQTTVGEPKRLAEQALPSANTILAPEQMEIGEDIDVHIIGDGRFSKYDVSFR